MAYVKTSRLAVAAAALLSSLILPSCGGGGGSGTPDDDPKPAPEPIAVTTNSGLAVGIRFKSTAAVDQFLLVAVSEKEAGVDLNNDGDETDHVAVAIDTTDGTQRNLGLAMVGDVIANDTHFAFQVSEGSQGGQDLNGDGDGWDAVWHLYEADMRIGPTNPFNTTIAATALGLPGIGTEGGFVLVASEFATGTDLNGDGDVTDRSAVAVNPASRAVLFFPSAVVQTNMPLVARNGRVLIGVAEPDAAVDLNLDGDQIDAVLMAIDFNFFNPMLRPVGGVAPRAVGGRPYALTDNAAVYFIDERGDAGIDLNTDGDTLDGVIAVFDLATSSGEMLPVSTSIPAFGIAGEPGAGIVTSADRAFFGISEADQQGRDLNGDMDWFDVVPGWIDTLTNPGRVHVQPLALAPEPIRIQNHVAILAISEFEMGAVVGLDLNGDFDTDDNVAFAIDTAIAPGTAINLALATAGFEMNGADVLIAVPEAGQFNGDMNGDGSADDIVSFYYDFSDRPPTRLPLGIVPTAISCVRFDTDEVRIAAILTEGQSPNYRDLNGDGDESDHGLVLLGLDPSFNPPRQRLQSPFLAGTASFFSQPPLLLGAEGFAFPTSEDMAGRDLNGDGDLDDIVLHYVRYAEPEE